MARVLSVGANSNGNVTLTNERPQFLTIEIPAGGTLNSLNVTGEVSGQIVNITGLGVQIIGQIGMKTQFTTTYILPLGLGRCDETVTINAVTGAGGSGVIIYAMSFQKSAYQGVIAYDMITMNPNTSQSFEKFYALGFAPQAGETYTIQGNDGILSSVTALEIRQLAGAETNLSATNVVVDNAEQQYSGLTIATGANPLTIFRKYLKTK